MMSNDNSKGDGAKPEDAKPPLILQIDHPETELIIRGDMVHGDKPRFPNLDPSVADLLRKKLGL